ncbi:MAG TPA: hypothetical protein PKA74_16250 [Bauldia sp.]|nr:hypothetical protein [Bauldia sp.]
MSVLEEHAAYFFALSDTLIPAYGEMPAFSAACTLADVAACLAFRPDVADDFNRAIAIERSGDGRAAVVELAADDPKAFSALGLIVVSAYHIAPRVRALIGYPGQESRPIRPGEADADLRDGLLQPVIDRGRRYVPTPAG